MKCILSFKSIQTNRCQFHLVISRTCVSVTHLRALLRHAVAKIPLIGHSCYAWACEVGSQFHCLACV